MPNHRLLLIAVSCALLAACNSSKATPTPGSPPPTLAPGEWLRVSGNGPFVSEPFELTAETTLRVHWDQSSNGKFLLSIVNLNPDWEDTPYGRVVYDYAIGASSGSGDYAYIPGSYVVKIESADGPWQVWIEVVETK
jgi:hypothetical protein